jgi:hypothetical protein
MLLMLKAVYQEHSLLDIERYQKEEYLKAMQKVLQDHYPDLCFGSR